MDLVRGAAAHVAARRDAAVGGTLGVSSGALRALLTVQAAQPISRAELARRLDVHRSTVSEIINPLLAAGVLREEAMEQPTGVRYGRPPVGLSFRGGSEFVVGVSVGVRTTQVGAATLDGRRLGEMTFDTPAEPVLALASVRSSVMRLRAAAPGLALGCVSVTVPGPTDAARTRLLYAPHLGWSDVAVADALRGVAGLDSHGSEDVGAGVTVVNDSTAAALYEARRRLRERPAEAWGDFLLVRVGTGIGVGLVQGGELFRGMGITAGLAGEFGHMIIVAGGKPCVCGNRGCWERYAAEPGAVALYTGERMRESDTGAPQFTEIISRARAGERRARATLARVGEYLGIGISNVVTGLGVKQVVVSGRIVEGWQFIKEPIDEAVARSMANRLARLTVEPSAPAGAGLGGALAVAAEQYLAALVIRKRVAA